MSTHDPGRLQGITAFVQAVERGSFSAAARHLGLSKSAVGKAVARLEQRLGVRLLDRTTRRLALTAEGADFHRSCRSALAELDEAEARVGARRREVAGTLRVSLPVAFGRRWVVPVLLELAQRHPALRLEISLSDRHVDLLEEGVDLAVRLGDPGDSAFLSARGLGRQRACLHAAPAYLARRGRPQTLDALAGHDCLVYGRGAQALPWTLTGDGGRTVVFRPRGRHAFDHGEALRDAACAGLGIAHLSAWLAADAVRSGALELPDSAADDMPLHALWPASRAMLPKVRAAVDALAAAFQPSPPWAR
ncbi:LysR family transcriptional regulator [Luteimonas sp. Y-2-2-4F]|nr:LysR substrate-binding domain-containing protein [Luteimonas sp. Y-2-2-4F]MCD9033060.1 LysR family transcriptional regulator [Luteimonas sp. Y-2-2-4F]